MTPDHDLTVTNVPRPTDHTALKSYAAGVEKRIGDIQRAAGELGGLRNVQVIIGTLVDERDAAKARVAELENAWKRLVSTEHAYVQGCSCPGCDPRGAADRIAELEGDLADAYRTEVERDRHLKTVAALTAVRDRLRERVAELEDAVAWLEGSLDGARANVARLERERDRARDVLRALAAAAKPLTAGSADGSHGQTMEAESWLSVALQAAQPVLGEGGPGTSAIVAREDLAVVLGYLTDPDAERTPEVEAAVGDLTAALQVAAGRSVEVVTDTGSRL